MDPSGALFFKDRAQWRKWLRLHHDKASEVWILTYKVKTGKKCLRYPEALEEALCYGWIDSRMRRVDDERHMLRFAPRRLDSIWSLVNRRLAERLIKEGRMTTFGLRKVEAAKANGNWDRALSPSKPPRIPKALKESLVRDELAWKNFQSLAKSYRTGFIYWVMTAKTDQTRSKRIEQVVRSARMNKKSYLG